MGRRRPGLSGPGGPGHQENRGHQGVRGKGNKPGKPGCFLRGDAAVIDYQSAIPVVVFFAFVVGVWVVLTMISQRNSRTQERLERHSRPASLAEIEMPSKVSKERKF